MPRDRGREIFRRAPVARLRFQENLVLFHRITPPEIRPSLGPRCTGAKRMSELMTAAPSPLSPEVHQEDALAPLPDDRLGR